ncbi:class I adenylate-forming enzyme family protein [Pseudorhodoferax soli]|uniref:Fatty-acyl-CoA synthase n=1 Tax=Pseudorhodoferax soli TaxID=545864 RepID=A0A368XPE5_9BURK|nr:AMP-binding protein [Pseudorhodoferax soli]RCW69419.1 fatty-acyl-CoA synthase [Pseudorhodoferax soli]
MRQSALGQMVVGNMLATAAVRFAQREAWHCVPTGRRYSFAQANARCNRLANGLLALGLCPGECVAFLSTNRAEVAEIYFALAKAGLVGLPLNYRLAPVEMLALMQEVGAVALLCERRFADLAAQVRVRVVFGEGATPAGTHDYEALLDAASASEPTVQVNEDDPYYFNLTSGTTGLPKCYLISHYNAATFANMFQALHMVREDVVMTVFPMYGRVGFAWVACGVMYGCRNVLTNFDAGQALDLIGRERVTITNLVPTMGAMLLARPELDGAQLGSLRALVFAGSLLASPVRDGVMARICPRLYEYYGMQETSTLVVSTPEDRVRRPDSVGQPILFAEVRVVDEAGRDVPVGQTGAVIGRSPGTVTGYYKNPDKTTETFRGGWLHTGDLGRLDDEGYLFINGRLKDVIVTGGQNVHAGEVEEAILRFDGVADCAVIGLPDPLWGESVSAVVVPAPGHSVDPDALLAWCRRSLAGFKTPKRVLLQADPLPRTATGKVQKFLLVARYSTPSAKS